MEICISLAKVRTGNTNFESWKCLCSKSGNAMNWRAQTMEMPVFGVHLQFAKPVSPGPEIAVQANTALQAKHSEVDR